MAGWFETLGTDWQKPFLEIIPPHYCFRRIWIYLIGEKTIITFKKALVLLLAFLLAAIHDAGLVSLTHTPSPMNFISKILNRWKTFLLIPVGYIRMLGSDLERKGIDEICIFY
jgi:hypothetical protein